MIHTINRVNGGLRRGSQIASVIVNIIKTERGQDDVNRNVGRRVSVLRNPQYHTGISTVSLYKSLREGS